MGGKERKKKMKDRKERWLERGWVRGKKKIGKGKERGEQES